MRAVLPVVLTLTAGTLGGFAFYLIGAPAAFLVGSAIAVTAMVALRLPTAMPTPLREPAFAILGMMMGTGVQPKTLDALITIPLAFLGLLVVIVAAGFASYVVLRHLGRWDPVTALCGSIPGALQIVLLVSHESGARMDRVVMAQALRLFILVSMVPLVFGGGDAPPIRSFAPADASPLVVAETVAIALASAYIGKRLRVPSAMMVMPLLVSAVLTSTGLFEVSVPVWLAAAAFVCLGAVVGTRFDVMKGADILPAVKLSLAAFVAAFIAAIAVSALFSAILGEPLGAVFLAYAPGGVDAMIALAFLLDYDIAFVAILHVARLLVLGFSAPLVVRWLMRRTGRQPVATGPP